VIVQFVWHTRRVTISARSKGYAAGWLKHHPWGPRVRVTRIEHERKALRQGTVSVYSILRDWIKGQVTAIAVGMLIFEGAFLGQILLPSGETVLERASRSDMLTLAAD
jgi:hypothetical protein